jgi:hypothetical protein
VTLLATKNRLLPARIAALFLLLWWGGLNCLAACIPDVLSVSEGEHCALGGGEGGCCAATGGDEEPSVKAPQPSETAPAPDCCALGETQAARPDEHRQTVAPQLHPVGEFSPPPAVAAASQHPATSRRARLPDGRLTYLRCRALLN